MGHNHIPLLPSTIQLPAAKLDKARWRSRVKASKLDDKSVGSSDAAQEAEAVYAPVAELAASAGDTALVGDTGAPSVRPGGVTAQALTDGTLRTLLSGQERLVDGEGVLDTST